MFVSPDTWTEVGTVSRSRLAQLKSLVCATPCAFMHSTVRVDTPPPHAAVQRPQRPYVRKGFAHAGRPGAQFLIVVRSALVNAEVSHLLIDTCTFAIVAMHLTVRNCHSGAAPTLHVRGHGS